MNRKYYLLTALFLILTIGLLILPELNTRQENSPENLLFAINRPGRFVTSDQVAHRIIERDPTMLLIDVREPGDYDEYSIEGALNIPLAEMLNDTYKGYMKLNGIDIVYYSNDDITAEKAWLIAERMGARNIYVLSGGLNTWMETIMRPPEPGPTASADDLTLYDFRKGACLYFKGVDIQMLEQSAAKATPAPRPARKTVVVQPHPQEEEAEGGC